jgi:hypothetical protein
MTLETMSAVCFHPLGAMRVMELRELCEVNRAAYLENGKGMACHAPTPEADNRGWILLGLAPTFEKAMEAKREWAAKRKEQRAALWGVAVQTKGEG